MKDLSVIILAAGNSTRLQSKLTKVMHPLCGLPMIDYVLAAARSLRPKNIVLVLGNDRDAVVEHLKGQKGLRFVHQKQRLGTAHAAQVGLNALAKFRGDVFILSGDVPLLKAATLQALKKTRPSSRLALLSAVLPEPFGYGRVIRDGEGRVLAIVEEKNASGEERQINEVNAGIYRADAGFLKKALGRVKKDPVKHEYYLTDIVAMAGLEGDYPQTLSVSDPVEILGANTRAELAYLEKLHRQELVAKLLAEGVGMQDPDAVYVDAGVRVGADSFLGAGVQLLGETRVGKGCRIEAGCILIDVRLEDSVRVKAYSHLESCVVKSGAVVGPFARLRPESLVEAEAHVGNFVELKKTRLGPGSKANHLSYLGDAIIGRGVNIGAGTITCNYDGKKKSPTRIADGVFVGSDTQLVAPVTVGKGAYIGAGTTVTKNVPPGSLAISRTPQVNVARGKKR